VATRMAQTGAAPPGKCDGRREEFASRVIRIILFPCSGSDRVAVPGSTMLSVIEFRALMLIHGPSNSWAGKIHVVNGSTQGGSQRGVRGWCADPPMRPASVAPIATIGARNCDAPSISAEQDGAWVGGLTDPMLAKILAWRPQANVTPPVAPACARDASTRHVRPIPVLPELEQGEN
jgi:hypothetical protein